MSVGSSLSDVIFFENIVRVDLVTVICMFCIFVASFSLLEVGLPCSKYGLETTVHSVGHNGKIFGTGSKAGHHFSHPFFSFVLFLL